MAHRTAAEKQEDEIRDQQIAVHHENVTNVPAASTEEAIGQTTGGKNEKHLKFELLGGEVRVTLGKETAVFDAENFRSVQRAVGAIGGSL